MLTNQKVFLTIFLSLGALLCVVLATPPSHHHGERPPTIIIKPQPPRPTLLPHPGNGGNGGTVPGTGTGGGTCPVPSEEMLRCIRQWACQYIIRLDLRCLLNLNGNPLLGGVLGGGPTSPVLGPGGGSGGGGLLGGILGL